MDFTQGKQSPRPLKQYLLLKESIPVGWAILAIAHAAIKSYNEFKEHPDTREWLSCFRKVVVKVSDKELDEAKNYDDFVVYSDEDYGSDELVLAFRPRREWPKFFRRLKLYA